MQESLSIKRMQVALIKGLRRNRPVFLQSLILI